MDENQISHFADDILKIPGKEQNLRFFEGQENLGLTQEMDPIKDFYLKTQQFIDTGEPWCGKIKIHGCKRILSAVLTSSKNKQCTTALLYSEHV